uniref:Integrase, catalytic region, zinc finger, CCHC-type, peptidase aspartic, catalytic n=1 Tax=Tanacetum cinerariifolium TaxID=118510 RepID=A0A699IUV4_TANCI|nr:hypothetical protein [Tanacetum cinerariifolium]
MELWVELKRLYEPDPEDQLWAQTQNYMHAPTEWKLYDLSGVHHVTPNDKEIFMLVEKDYPLRKGLALVMISYKLQVENYSQMPEDLIQNIYNIANTPKIAEITRMKMNDLECVTRKVKISPHDYSKENLLATFTPQKQLTPEQIFWSNDLMKMKFEALKERTKVSRPIKAFTVITPSAITDRERGFEQTKACYLQEVIPFFKTLKDNFKGNQKALTKEVKEMKDVFEELEAEVAQYTVDKKHDAIELKNLPIDNDNLITECLSQEVFCVATNYELNVARFTDMHVANTTAETRCLALEAELANLRETNNQDNQKKLINHFSKLKHYKELYDSIKITRAKHIEQLTKVTTKNMNLKIGVSKATINPLVSARDKHAIDVEPIIPRLRNNRNAHLDYLRHLKESVETIRDIVEEAKVVRPLDRSIVSACRYTKYSQELLEYAIGTYPQGSQPRTKQLAHIPLIRKKQKTNVPMPPSTGMDCCPIASGSQPMSHVKPNRISPAKGDNKLPVDD